MATQTPKHAPHSTPHSLLARKKISESQKARLEKINSKLQLIENALHSKDNEQFIKDMEDLKKHINNDIDRLTTASKIIDRIIPHKDNKKDNTTPIGINEITRRVTEGILNK